MREKILNKIHELEWKNNVRSLEIIEFLKWLLAELPEEKKEEIKKVVKIEVPSWLKWWSDAWIDELKTAPKRKIVFKKKK